MERVIIGVLLLSLLSGCIGEDIGTKTDGNATVGQAQQQQQATPMPSFSIISPSNGTRYETDRDNADVQVQLTTSNLIIRPAGGATKTGEGHFVFRIDGGSMINVFSKSYLLKAVQEGTHTLSVELVHNDGNSYSPAIKESVTFEVSNRARSYQPKNYTVDIMDFSYEPASLTVKAGDSVVFRNKGNYPRSATSTGNFDTKVLASGERAVIRMDREGTFNYFSLTYKPMEGTMVVLANSTVT